MKTKLVATVAALLALTACTEDPAPAPTQVAAPALQLVSYDSCDKLLADVRTAAKASVQPWGFGNEMLWRDFASGGMERATGGKNTVPDAAGPAYSGTNTHEVGVDEPDLVKTDGKRIVTLSRSALRIVDAAQHKLAGVVELPEAGDQLLLSGDHALVFGSPNFVYRGIPQHQRTTIWLVDLPTAKVLSTYTIDGSLTDARQIGSVARVVVRSTPKIVFKQDARGDQKTLIANNRKVIDKSPIDAWLPAYTSDGTSGTVDCGDVRHPATFSGASLVTVLSFDLAAAQLADGVPSAVFADADTVYGSGAHLYLANDERWRGLGTTGKTELYMFDITGRQPRYVAAGTVGGWLLSQYSMSESDGVLRVATTTGHPWAQNTKSTSTVYALRSDGGSLRVVGSIGGLGKGEQIYAVRFVGPTAYVVTFRRTDPLYVVDLRDPAKPVVAGQLKIPGYSAYLHPVGGDRLLGVGQAADDNGRVQGTQISLFDVADPANPKRLANHEVGDHGYSEAEFDPHAFLYWPDTKLLVVPVQKWNDDKGDAGALLIKVGDGGLTEAGWISHPQQPKNSYYPTAIRRSLVIGDELWTVSDSGLMASTLANGKRVSWLPY
ncbi:MAG: benzoate transporter [Hamadaea sp.]|uniref:beta-propeller domain-containing protein n=1 Tax=Hamadaea sp. TaxID=2024425 RepID=UPI001850C229|nr:beta-propeller domain-containing protein [Hamadaea sp.]NUR73763.1 benzoate transporter [Hamadaea sp.]NUT17839.1 benzoate transporter [Hamadaea sp.]